jgi:[acyl-carrier-protein] S-malonyltransferase
MKKAFIFPGQGSQYPGMGLEIFGKYPAARAVFEEADDVLGFSLSKLCFEGPAEALKLTENTQPAILATSIAVFRVLEERGLKPDYVAGHSLGEYSALVAAGALKLSDAVKLVRRRGQYMQEAVPVGAGAMAAILGLDPAGVETLCARAAFDGANAAQIVAPANLNSPGQIVIAGHREAVERAVGLAKGAGARRAILLQVSAPFHCQLLKPAEVRLAPDLDACPIVDLKVPLVTNVDARIVTTANEARDGLKRQVSRPVRWHESVQAMIGDGVGTFVETGPGKVLIGLVRSIDESVATFNAEDEKSLENVFSALL